MFDEIVEIIKKHQNEIKEFGVRKFGIFGSVVRGEETKESDLDILVQLEKETFRSYMGLKFFLEDLFNRKVDLVLNTAIKESLREKILQEVHYVEGF